MEIQRIRLIRFTGQWKIAFLKITIEGVQLRNDADGKLQKVSVRCFILFLENNLVTVKQLQISNIVQKCSKFRTLQLLTYRLNNHSRSLGSLELIIYSMLIILFLNIFQKIIPFHCSNRSISSTVSKIKQSYLRYVSLLKSEFVNDL